MEEKRLIELIGGFSGKNIAVIGDVALDSYMFGKVERVNPERPGYPLLKVEKDEFRLGCAGNVALNVASLGAKCFLFGRIGEDSAGEVFEKQCGFLGINLVPIREGKTILKQRAIESTHNDYLWRVDIGEADIDMLSSDNVGKIIRDLDKKEINAIILSDYNKGMFRGELGMKIIEWANSKNVVVVVDPKPVNIDKFHSATVFCPNVKEAKEIIGDLEDEELSKGLKEKVNCKYSVITCGERGIISYDGGFHHIPTRAQEVIDVTGAGDTVASALALSIACGASIVEAADIANHAAGIVVGKSGTASVSQKELIRRLAAD